jgi:ATP-dependent helicase/nuclease subunit B
MASTPQSELPSNLTLHVGDEEALFERAGSTSDMELVVAPVELHRRNLQRRLRESRTPKDGFEFVGPTGIAERVLEADDRPNVALDRIDRLTMIRSVLRDGDPSVAAPAVPSDPQALEQLRTEVESVTGFHPARIDRLREIADGLDAPIDADAGEITTAAVGLERALRRRAEKAVSEVELLRRATRGLTAADGDPWRAAFPDVERVSLVGVSGLPIAHVDLLTAIARTTSVSIDVHFRRGTGAYLEDRFPALLEVADPGSVVFDP